MPRLALLCLLFVPPTLQSSSGRSPDARIVSRDEILEAMRQSSGYDLTATANGARLQAEVLLGIVREAHARDTEGPPLFLGREEWFLAYLERTGLAAEKAPLYVRLAHEHGQDLEVDYRSVRVLKDVGAGPRPRLAANVRIWWPEARGGPTSYSYEDTLSTPRLKVTNKRVIAYRLLDFGDMIVFGEIEGLFGRPTSGVLGLLFQLIGEARIEENRMTISWDGLQISRARGQKAFIEKTLTVTVYPDGRTEKDLPPNRPDLLALEARLKQPLKVSYQPMDAPPRAGGAVR